MEYAKEIMRQSYKEDPTWKEDSDELFGREEAAEQWRMLQEENVVPEGEEDVVVVGASENLPTHLVGMWREDLKSREGSSLFLSGDLAFINSAELFEHDVDPYTDEKHQFKHFQWDAENLPLASDSVDLMFDYRGWLWHSARSFDGKERTLDAFYVYHDILKEDGVLIIDAIPGFNEYLESLPPDKRTEAKEKLKKAASGEEDFRPSEIYPDAPDQYQPSTVDVLEEEYGSEIWEDIANLYDIRDVGEGKYKVRVLKKKAS